MKKAAATRGIAPADRRLCGVRLFFVYEQPMELPQLKQR